jgi:uncharacterized protein
VKLELAVTEACMESLPPALASKVIHLKSLLLGLRPSAVAFSGGVDSTLLLCLAREWLGGDVTAVTARSEVMSHRELEEAARLAAQLSVPHWFLDSGEMSLADFARNDPDRCYICKRARYAVMLDWLEPRGIRHLLDGSNADDASDYRPGSRAVRELGVRTPLQEAGWSKEEIRLMARHLGLDCWNRPASACLASRIPYGSPITREKLEQVERAEELLSGLSISGQVRVRHHGDLARIEVDESYLSTLADEPVRKRIVEHLTGLGFTYVTLDLGGYRMGSLNAAVEKRRDIG